MSTFSTNFVHVLIITPLDIKINDFSLTFLIFGEIFSMFLSPWLHYSTMNLSCQEVFIKKMKYFLCSLFYDQFKENFNNFRIVEKEHEKGHLPMLFHLLPTLFTRCVSSVFRFLFCYLRRVAHVTASRMTMIFLSRLRYPNHFST